MDLQKIKDYNERRKAEAEKRQTVADSQKSAEALIKELREVQIAALLSNNQKPSVILADSTDLGERIADLGKQVVEVMEAFRGDTKHADGMNKLGSMYKALTLSLQASQNTQTKSIDKAAKDIITAIKNQQLVVPAPEVTVETSPPDFSRLEEIMKSLLKALTKPAPSEKLDLSDYRAHDLDNAPDSKQYIGFISPTGGWYIMQSDDGALRYYFGAGDYETAWSDRYSHDYQTLNGALNALRS